MLGTASRYFGVDYSQPDVSIYVWNHQKETCVL
jgi:hypothetical protein